jgi:hypothetical protein
MAASTLSVPAWCKPGRGISLHVPKLNLGQQKEWQDGAVVSVSGSGATVRVSNRQAVVPAATLSDSKLCVPILHEQQPCEPPILSDLEAVFDTHAGGRVLMAGNQVKLKDRHGYFYVEHIANDVLTLRECWAVGEEEFNKYFVVPVGTSWGHLGGARANRPVLQRKHALLVGSAAQGTAAVGCAA